MCKPGLDPIVDSDKIIRETNIDLLRIICSILVIVVHLNTVYLDVDVSKTFWGEVYTNNLEYVYFFNALDKVAVPLFFMISGAFLFNNPKNINISYFYKKSFNKLGLSTILFSIFYLLLSQYVIKL